MSPPPPARKKRRRGSPKAVGEMLETVLGELGLDAAARAFRVGEVWADTVGEAGAAHSTCVGLRGSVLEVSVDSSVWCQQLQLEKARLLEGLAERLGEDAPSDIRFRMGLMPGSR